MFYPSCCLNCFSFILNMLSYINPIWFIFFDIIFLHNPSQLRWWHAANFSKYFFDFLFNYDLPSVYPQITPSSCVLIINYTVLALAPKIFPYITLMFFCILHVVDRRQCDKLGFCLPYYNLSHLLLLSYMVIVNWCWLPGIELTRWGNINMDKSNLGKVIESIMHSSSILVRIAINLIFWRIHVDALWFKSYNWEKINCLISKLFSFNMSLRWIECQTFCMKSCHRSILHYLFILSPCEILPLIVLVIYILLFRIQMHTNMYTYDLKESLITFYL